MPEVSIGLPVHNGEKYIEEALTSICGQTFDDFELVISDNASADKTGEICQTYAAKDSRIKYVRQSSNVGAVRNWNYVAAAATGRFFKWASANDCCERTMLAKCVDVLRRDRGVVLCYGRTCLIDDAGVENGIYQYDFGFEEARPSERFVSLLNRMNLNNAQSGLIRYDALASTRLDRSYPHGDRVLMAELALRGKICLLPEVLLFRRIAKGAASGLLSERDLKAFLDPALANRGMTTLRLHADCFFSVLRAPVPWQERLPALSFVSRSVYWDREILWRELTGRAE